MFLHTFLYIYISLFPKSIAALSCLLTYRHMHIHIHIHCCLCVCVSLIWSDNTVPATNSPEAAHAVCVQQIQHKQQPQHKEQHYIHYYAISILLKYCGIWCVYQIHNYIFLSSRARSHSTILSFHLYYISLRWCVVATAIIKVCGAAAVVYVQFTCNCVCVKSAKVAPSSSS